MKQKIATFLLTFSQREGKGPFFLTFCNNKTYIFVNILKHVLFLSPTCNSEYQISIQLWYIRGRTVVCKHL